MTGPTPVVSPKTKRIREKEPYSDDESEKLSNNGDKGRRFYTGHQDQVRTGEVNENKMVEQVLEDEERQARFWRCRPDGFAVNEKEHIIYVLEFKRVSDTGQEYVSETQ